MVLPSDREIQLALLRAIEEAGGEVKPSDVYGRVTAQFPALTPQDLAGTLSSGQNRWTNRIQWMRQKLVQNGDIAQQPRGIWRITAQGRQRIASGGRPTINPLPTVLPPLNDESIHRQVQTQIAEIGVMLGYYSSTEHKLEPYRYDVIWKRDQWQPSPGNVFEVQHHGSLEAALLKLKHAHDVCKPRLCLVVTGERDERRVRELVGPLFSGVFHEIRSETLILTAQQVADLHGSLIKQEDILQRLVGK